MVAQKYSPEIKNQLEFRLIDTSFNYSYNNCTLICTWIIHNSIWERNLKLTGGLSLTNDLYRKL